jgi:hypothetical protein
MEALGLPAFLAPGPGHIRLAAIPPKTLKMICLLFATQKAPLEAILACQLSASAYFAGKSSVTFGGQQTFPSHYAIVCGQSGINKSGEIVTDLQGTSTSLRCVLFVSFSVVRLPFPAINLAEARIRETRGLPRTPAPKIVGGRCMIVNQLAKYACLPNEKPFALQISLTVVFRKQWRIT